MKYDEIFKDIKKLNPLVHNITNYVTVNDCANIQIAFGGSPIMADDLSEVQEVTSKCSSLLINIGTLNKSTVSSMIIAGREANKKNIPIILDPVGYGFTRLRRESIKKILKEVDVSIIKGNVSEIKGLVSDNTNIQGVDISYEDQNMTKESLKTLALNAANTLKCIIVITGALDVISDGKETYFIQNGSSMMSEVTGTGCMTGALLAVSAGAHTNNLFASSIVAVSSMGVAGELAAEKTNGRRTSSFKMHLIDSISSMTPDILIDKMRCSNE